MPNPTFVYVGTYTGPKSKGIYLFRLQTENLEVSQNILLVPLGLAAETPSPSFLELDVKRQRLFAVNELGEFEGKPGGAVSAFSIDPKTGALRLLNQRPAMGGGPCHLVSDNYPAEIDVHPSGKWVYVSNRGHNSVVLFTADFEKGTLTYVEEQGTGGKTPRHFGIEPSAKHLAIGNQESDTVLVCRIDAGNGRLKPSGVFASVPTPACVKFLPPME